MTRFLLTRHHCLTANGHKTALTRKVLALLTISIALCNCSFFEPHKIPIQQGNVVTQEMVNKLKPGMTKRQVNYILGTPLVVDPFDQNHWHYNYKVQRGVKVISRYRFSITFENDKLTGFTGDFKPSDAKSENKDNAPLADKSPSVEEEPPATKEPTTQ